MTCLTINKKQKNCASYLKNEVAPARVVSAWVSNTQVSSALIVPSRVVPAWVASGRVALLEFLLFEFNLSYCSYVVVNFKQRSWFNSHRAESSGSSGI